jgi:hypothetical protein
MFKKLFLLGIASGILSAIAALIYNKIYFTAMAVDFSKIINPLSIVSICLGAGIIASVAYTIFHRWLKSKTDIIFNPIFAILSFATVMSPFSAKLPLDIQSPELFPGLAIPMHFFPVLAWLVLKPLFFKKPEFEKKLI